MRSLLPILLIGGGAAYAMSRKKKRKAKAKVEEEVEAAKWIDKGNYRYTDDCQKLEIGGYDVETVSKEVLASGGKPSPEVEKVMRAFIVEDMLPAYALQIEKHGTRPESMVQFLFDVAEGLMPGCKMTVGEEAAMGSAMMLSLIAGGMPAYFDAKGYMPMVEVLKQTVKEIREIRGEDFEGYTLPDGKTLLELFEEWKEQEEEPKPLPPDEGETQLASFVESDRSVPAWIGETFIVPNV